MLDNATLEDTVAADDGQDTIEAAGEDTLAAEEEVVISIEGEEPEPDPDAEVEAELGDAGKRALKAARDAAKSATDHFDPLVHCRLGNSKQRGNFLTGAIVGDESQHFPLLFR